MYAKKIHQFLSSIKKTHRFLFLLHGVYITVNARRDVRSKDIDSQFSLSHGTIKQGPDLLNILRQSYDYLTIMPMLRSTYDGRSIYKTSYEGRKAFLRYDSLAKS